MYDCLWLTMKGSMSATMPVNTRASCRCAGAKVNRLRSQRNTAWAKPTRASTIEAVVPNQSSRLPMVEWCMTMGCHRKGQVYHFELAALSQVVKPAWCCRRLQFERIMPDIEMGCRVRCRAAAPTATYTSEASANIQAVCQIDLPARRRRIGASSKTHTPVHLLATARPTQSAAPANQRSDRAHSIRARAA